MHFVSYVNFKNYACETKVCLINIRDEMHLSLSKNTVPARNKRDKRQADISIYVQQTRCVFEKLFRILYRRSHCMPRYAKKNCQIRQFCTILRKTNSLSRANFVQTKSDLYCYFVEISYITRVILLNCILNNKVFVKC